MFYQLRVARDQDTEALDFEKADTAHAEIDQQISRFIVLEDSEKDCRLSRDRKIQRRKRASPFTRHVGQAESKPYRYTVSKYGCAVQKHEIQDVYLVANQPSSAEFLNVMGFEACANAPDELYTSEHFRNSLCTEGSF